MRIGYARLVEREPIPLLSTLLAMMPTKIAILSIKMTRFTVMRVVIEGMEKPPRNEWPPKRISSYALAVRE
jgi:hypothetical protein